MPRSWSCFSIAGETPGSFLRSSATPRGPGSGSKPRLFSAGFGRSSTTGRSAAPRSTPAPPWAREMPSIAALRDQIAVQRDGAAGVVIARHHEGDAVRIAVGVDHGGDRDVEPPRLLDRDVFLVGVDHEQEVGQPAHVLDAAERAVELVALALQVEALLLGVAAGLVGGEQLLELAQPRDRAGNGLPVGQRAAEPARVDVVLRAALGGFGDRRPAPGAWCRRTGCGRPWRPCRSRPPSALCSIGTLCARSMMWMLLRVPKMYSPIFGFQRWA